MNKYKCIAACPYKTRNYKVGDIDSFEEPMNPRVWQPLEEESISFEDFVEYCRKKHIGELPDDDGGDPDPEEDTDTEENPEENADGDPEENADEQEETENVEGEEIESDTIETQDKPILDEAVRYEVSREGNRYKVSKFVGESENGEIIKKDLLKSDAEGLAEVLSKTDED